MITETIEVVDAQGVQVAQFQLSLDMGGVAMMFNGVWHSPTLLEQYALHLSALAQTLRDAGVN
jgi:hypothetical protein